MKRRSKAGGEPIKGRRGKTPVPKRRNAPKDTPDPNLPNSENELEFRRLARELSEAREQQAATSEVLKAISGSTFDLRTVLDTLLQSAVRLCRADQGTVAQRKGDTFYRSVSYGFSPAYLDYVKDIPVKPGRDTGTGRALLEGKVIHIPDVLADPDFTWKEGQRLGGFRTVLGVPMLREGVAVGVLALTRSAVRPFSGEQITLVENFAAQTAIAIENARLLDELRQRTTDLTEALEQQRATSDLLQVISGSPGNLEPIFQAMLQNAVAICDANFGNMFLYEDNAFRTVAMYNAPEAYATARSGAPFHPPSHSGLGRLAATREVVQIGDLRAEEMYINRDPFVVAGVELGGIRTLLAVPMLKEGHLVGAIVIYRQEVRQFCEKQIALVKNFASQVVIAIENARLLNELRKRTTDLTEALEQQTATSEVLRVISSTPGDLQPVFATMLENAVRVCEAKFGNIYRWDGDALHLVATHNTPPAYAEERRLSPYRPYPHSPIGRMVADKTLAHVSDLMTEEVYVARLDPVAVSAATLGGIRTLLGVPLVSKGDLIGAFFLSRQEVRPFTDKQIELVKNFAAQAVIAIENARLLKELRERTDQLQEQSQELAKLNQDLEQRVADQVGEIERMGRLRRFLPPQVADLIVASGSEKQLESHRREITALFCDLRGFTGFSESSDPEDVMALLRDYHAAIGEIIIKYSGTLERYAGDGVMVVFNDPVPVENPALQAVLMALEMRDAIGALTETWRRWGHDIGFGIGIAHGFATLGTIGFEGRFDYAAIGTVSNVASRLCDEAKPGQILISPRVLTKVENSVKVEPVGEFELKGIRRPLTAYNVIGTAAKG
jgi:GAF domain-containing protein